MKLTALTFSLFALHLACCLPDYYWRDYNGVVPDDAVVGGSNQFGEPTYIGQALLEGGLMPCTIYNGEKTVNVDYYGLLKVGRTGGSIKILCSGRPENFYWVAVNRNKISTRSRTRSLDFMVIGGFEFKSECALRIGRAKFEQELVVGKVNCDPKLRVYFATEEKQSSADTFEILAFNVTNQRRQSQAINLSMSFKVD